MQKISTGGPTVIIYLFRTTSAATTSRKTQKTTLWPTFLLRIVQKDSSTRRRKSNLQGRTSFFLELSSEQAVDRMCVSPFSSCGSADSASRSDFLDSISKGKSKKNTYSKPIGEAITPTYLISLSCSRRENKNKMERIKR